MNAGIGGSPSDTGDVATSEGTATADDPAIAEGKGIALVGRFAAAAKRRSESLFGPFSSLYETADIVQITHPILCKELGRDYATRLAMAAQAGQKFKATGEYQTLRRAANAAVSRLRIDNNREKLAKKMSLDSATAARDESEDRDQILSLKQAMDSLLPIERKVIELRRKGHSFEEIAQELHLRGRQTTHKIARDAMRKIARCMDSES